MPSIYDSMPDEIKALMNEEVERLMRSDRLSLRGLKKAVRDERARDNALSDVQMWASLTKNFAELSAKDPMHIASLFGLLLMDTADSPE